MKSQLKFKRSEIKYKLKCKGSEIKYQQMVWLKDGGALGAGKVQEQLKKSCFARKVLK